MIVVRKQFIFIRNAVTRILKEYYVMVLRNHISVVKNAGNLSRTWLINMTKFTNEVVQEIDIYFKTKKNTYLTRAEYERIKRLCYKIAYK